MLAAWQIGPRMGTRMQGKGGVKPSKFDDDASIGLLGLLLALGSGTRVGLLAGPA
jgi:hypothetical protein